jgi:hypothetical protein
MGTATYSFANAAIAFETAVFERLVEWLAHHRDSDSTTVTATFV